MKIATYISRKESWSRTCLTGVLDYFSDKPEYQLINQPAYSSNQKPNLIEDFNGIIAPVYSADFIKKMRQNGLPFVNLTLSPDGCDCYYAVVDYYEMGKLAANHLLKAGMSNFIYLCLNKHSSYMKYRFQGFADTINKAGYPCKQIHSECQSEQIEDLISSVEEKTGFLTNQAQVGCSIIQVCRKLEIACPEKISVVSADYDEILCRTATPKLTAIIFPGEQIGYKAAELLHQQIEAIEPEDAHVMVKPNELYQGGSAEKADMDINAAMAYEFICNNIGKGISVTDIVNTLPVSRRTLENRFKASYGKTINEAIGDLRFQKAASLLQSQQLTVSEIAFKSGFATPQSFHKFFHKKAGMTPTDFRQRVQF